MTADEVQDLHNRIAAADGYVMWFVSNPAPDRFIARAMGADFQGGHQEGDDLAADTLDALRAMLPAGLTRWDRTMMMVRDVVETWD